MRREIQLHWEQTRRRTEDEKAVRDRERLQEEMQALEGQEVTTMYNSFLIKGSANMFVSE
jgi:DNA-binding protein Fis